MQRVRYFPYLVLIISQLYQTASKEVSYFNTKESKELTALSKELSWGITRQDGITDYLREFAKISNENPNFTHKW